MKDSRFVSVAYHTTHAFQVMNELRQQGGLCDITLCIEQREFHAHRIVLAGCSPYLRAMFTNGMLESEKSMIEIHGIDPDAMEILIDFMYRGSLEITIENVQALLQGASLLSMVSLRNACSQFLQSQLDASNCIGIQSFADMYSCAELDTAAQQYLEQHFSDVVRGEEFFQLSEKKLISILKNERIQVEKEEQIFEAVVTWVEIDPTRRESLACTILPNIKLALLELQYLEEVVVRTNFIRNCPKCQNIVAVAHRMKMDNNALATIRTRAQPQCIFVVGGRTSVHTQLKSMERYDVWRDQWIPMGNMNIARTAVGVGTLNGFLYSAGGECAILNTNEDTLYLRSLECYDPILKQWETKRDMKIPRSFITLAALGQCLYAVGGENRSVSFDIMEKYDPKLDTWSFAPSMKRKRAGAGCAVCEGKIYVAGGYDKTFHTDRASVEVFDPEYQEWTFIAEMSKARSGLVLVAIEYSIYAIGGRFRHTDRYYDLVEKYNTITQQWTTLTAMNTPRAWPAATVYEGKIYAMGGFDGFNRLRTAEVYDPENDSWSYISNMNISRAGSGSAIV
ncbi:kelch-like protein 12 isoform X2 [Lineus longissimus]